MNLTIEQTHGLVYATLGLLVVLATSLVKNINFTPKQSHAVAVVLSFATAAVATYFQTNGTTALFDVAKHSTAVYAASQLLYGFAIQNTTLNAWLTKFNLIPSNK